MRIRSVSRAVVAAVSPAVLVFFTQRLRMFVAPAYDRTDPLMHFLGGMAIAWLAWTAYRALRGAGRLPALPRWWLALTVVSGAVFAGVLWEFYEFAVFTWLDPTWNLTLPDTIGDLLLDLVGGAAMAGIAFLAEREPGSGG